VINISNGKATDGNPEMTAYAVRNLKTSAELFGATVV
jgi:hypothetical protein